MLDSHHERASEQVIRALSEHGVNTVVDASGR